VKQLAKAEFLDALASCGIERGDVLHVQSDLRRVGPVESAATREAMLEFYWEALWEVLGSRGTLTVLTSTLGAGRYGTPFVREETPSEMGVFSEYVRTRNGTVRSLHPITSLAAHGVEAKSICDRPHFEGFGWNSPWTRLVELGAKMLTLGMGTMDGGTTFFHYIESMHGVPYKYTKLLQAPVFAGGVQVPGPFTMSVRYLDFGIKNTPVRLKQHLTRGGWAREVATGAARSWCVPFADAFREGMSCLTDDRYFLLESPPRFRPGEIPADRPTGPLRERVDHGKAP
jgi:aminoglycoside 3-N-acetyltransferase